MEYKIYKLEFLSGAHFGNGMLNDSICTFQADILFSALYIEALKCGIQDTFYQAVKEGRLLFSDAFPYIRETYLIPKPMLYIESKNKGNSDEKKYYKRLKYLPVGQLHSFLNGEMDIRKNPMEHFGEPQRQAMSAVRTGEETLPFFVGTYRYHDGNGLYVIVAYEGKETLQMAERLFESLSYTGIGGKKASGFGRYELKMGKRDDALLSTLKTGKDKGDKEIREKGKRDRWMLLSTALPRDEELESALDGASYLLEKRSGFVASETYAQEEQKKRDLYVFSAGSCFAHRFEGDLFDVSRGGNHPVYRYAKPLFMGV